MSWDIYTIGAVVAGLALLVLAAMGGSIGERAWMVVGGLAFVGYGIYVATQTTGDFSFPVVMFIIPLIAVGAAVMKVMERLRSASRPGR